MLTPQDWTELWSERAAIYEFDGGLDRGDAEQRAMDDVRAAQVAEVSG